jgi:hypothetical protein
VTYERRDTRRVSVFAESARRRLGAIDPVQMISVVVMKVRSSANAAVDSE